jgi:ribosomal protein L9
MKVILQHTVLKLGKAGDIVEASAGYYRNFLQPRKLAVLATDGTLKKREEDLAVIQKKAQRPGLCQSHRSRWRRRQALRQNHSQRNRSDDRRRRWRPDRQALDQDR